MTKHNWSALFLGLMLSSAVACRPIAEEDPVQETIELPTATSSATAIAQQPTATSEPPVRPTSAPPLSPTPEPTIGAKVVSVLEWRRIGDDTTALEMAVPSKWVDLSGQIDVSEATSRLGLIVLLAADSSRTGSSILAGKAVSSGAFVAGMILNQDVAADDPVSALSQLIADSGIKPDMIGAPSPFQTPRFLGPSPGDSLAADVFGASADVAGDPAGLIAEGAGDLRTRIVLFPFDHFGEMVGTRTHAVILQSAPASQWNLFDEVFELMAGSVVMRDPDEGFSINDGGANLLGSLAGMEAVNGRLDNDSNDIWTFEADDNQYATFTLTPIDADIDLTLSIIGPTGELLSRVDNGYAGDAEVSADLFIVDQGTYLVEVGEFFGNSGRYALSLIINEEPLFGSTGRIVAGQGIQSELLENARQSWTFEGTAGQTVSIILSPNTDQMDMILELFGPEGQRLLSLDEGFSGDAEVIAGYVLPVTGEYTLRVRSFAGNGGTYSLSLDEGGENTLNYFDAGDLSDGNVASELLRANEAHAWFFEGRVGEEISIEITPLSEELDVDVWLLDPNVTKLAAADDFAAGEPESIHSVLTQDGQYIVLVRDFYGQPGGYEISFTAMLANAPTIAGTLAFGNPLTDTLEAGQSTLWYFRADVDDILEIRLVPLDEDDDLLFILQDPAANTVLEVDTAVAGLPEELNNFKITSNGRWRLIIKEFFADAADYTLAINRLRR